MNDSKIKRWHDYDSIIVYVNFILAERIKSWRPTEFLSAVLRFWKESNNNAVFSAIVNSSVHFENFSNKKRLILQEM